MRFGNTLILVALFLALMAYVVYSGQQSSPPLSGANFIYSLGSENVQKIAVQSREGSMAVERQGEEWFLTKPMATKADAGRMNGVVLAVSGMVADRSVVTGTVDLAPYGLISPAMTATLTTKDGQGVTVFFGEQSPVTGSSYVKRLDGDVVYLVSPSWTDVLQRLVTELPLPQEPTPTPAPPAR